MKTKKTKLVLEVNEKYIDGDKNKVSFLGIPAMITPPLDEDYWQFRVKVHDDQEIVGFPKFNTIGVGFAKEDDWNTNLPYVYKAEQIFDHIKRNKRYASIEDKVCIQAIKMIQQAAKEFQKAEQEAEDLVLMMNEPMLKDEATGKIVSKKEFKERCHILKARRADTFVRTVFGETTEIKKFKFCMLYGYMEDQRAYKYKFTFYSETREKALERFNYIIRMVAKYGEEAVRNSQIDDRFETLRVAQIEENKVCGYKIPISF